MCMNLRGLQNSAKSCVPPPDGGAINYPRVLAVRIAPPHLEDNTTNRALRRTNVDLLYLDLPPEHSQYTIDTKNSGTLGWWT